MTLLRSSSSSPSIHHKNAEKMCAVATKKHVLRKKMVKTQNFWHQHNTAFRKPSFPRLYPPARPSSTFIGLPIAILLLYGTS